MSEVYCNDPTCKEHYCQISGRRLNVKDNIYPDAIILTQWQMNIQNRINELEHKESTNITKTMNLYHEHRKRIEDLESDLGDLKDKVEELENKINSDEKIIGPVYGLTEKTLSNLPIYNQGEKIIPTKKDIEKNKTYVHITTVGAIGGSGSGASDKVIKEDLSFWEAFEAMKKGHKVRCKLWLTDYICLNEGKNHFISENGEIFHLYAYHINKKWRIVRE